MKICFIFEGIPHYYVHILDEINKQHQVSVVLPKKGEYFKKEGIKTSEDGSFKRYYLKKKKTYYRKDFFEGFYECVDTIKPDLLIFPWPYFLQLLFNPFLILFLRKNKIKVGTKEIPFFTPKYDESLSCFRKRTVTSLKNEKIFRSPIYFNLMKWVRKKIYSTYIDYAFNYISDGKEILSSYGLEKDNIFTTFNSHNTQDTFAAIKKAEGVITKPNRIVHIGRLAKWKRVDLLLDAVNVLKNKFSDIELLIIGDGQEFENLKLQAKKKNIEKHVVFLGAVYDKVTIAEYLLSCQLYVLAGMGGLSINEAMCHSLPIVCSTCDGTEKDLVYEGINGAYFEKDNKESLVEIIDKLLTNKNQLSKMGEESLKIVLEKINEKEVVKRYLQAFAQIETELSLKK